MGRFTLILTYYENPNMLKESITFWNTYSKKVVDNMDIIIVDDGSLYHPAYDIIKDNFKQFDLQLHLFRIKENIPWNQDGARNLAMTYAKGFSLLSDIDHILSNECAEKIIEKDMWEKEKLYFFNRRFTPKEEERRRQMGLTDIKYSLFGKFINIYFIHHDLYWYIGGYDESFVGKYGSDRMFRKKLIEKKVNFSNPPSDIFLNAYTSKDIHDSYTSNFDRYIPTKEEFEEMEKTKTPLINFKWNKLI